jgi:hypothetical protein
MTPFFTITDRLNCTRVIAHFPTFKRFENLYVTNRWWIIVIYATSFCVNWAFLIARVTRLKHERSEGFKASRAIRKAQFTQKRIACKILLFETTSLKLPNLLKMVSHLLLTVLTNFLRPVRNVTLYVQLCLGLGQQFLICSFCFRAVKRQFTKEKNENLWQLKTINFCMQLVSG